jgi:DNA-binding NtrC family response regulator
MVSTQSQTVRTELRSGTPDEVRILIVSDDDSMAERLKNVLSEAGLLSESAKSITAGCELARSGRFQAVITTPVLTDGSWRRLVEIASHFDLGFEVVLAASTFDQNDRAVALKDGAFDVLDTLHELLKAAEVTKCALWASYLKGAGPCPEAASPRKAA